MSATAALARDIARLLLDYADRMDAADAPGSPAQELPPLPGGAFAQLAVLETLRDAPEEGLSARVIADMTDIAQANVYEKLRRLTNMGYVEEVPDSLPTHWRLTLRAKLL
jgi:DNA-binding MarR family transcriptional regulator